VARPPKISDDQILEAAREVFLEYGYGGSTLEIAKKSGISEASIFKRFSTKEKLFFAAMGVPDVPRWINELNALAGKGDIKQNLVNICLKILDFFREMMPRLMQLQARGKSLPKPGIKNEKYTQDINAITRFLQQEMNQGRLGICEPRIVAQIILGTLMNYIFLEQIDARTSQSENDLNFVTSLIEALWKGLAPIQHRE
jgi:AcrR family transcriptional regulator